MREERLKFCGRCRRTLPTTEFAKSRTKKDGLQERCRECRAEHYQLTKHKKKKPTREQRRKWRIATYGITVDEYNAMLFEQDGRCAICGSEDWGHVSPSIDHCHDTGTVRGLLCNDCNGGIGKLKDDPGILVEAAVYLAKSDENALDQLKIISSELDRKIERIERHYRIKKAFK